MENELEHDGKRPVDRSTVLITVDGVRLLTDPLLRAFVVHLRRRVPVHPDALMPVDAVPSPMPTTITSISARSAGWG